MEETIEMARIDKDKCLGCGICTNICPSGFGMSNGKAYVMDTKADCINRAMDSCPASAIIK